MLSFAGVVLAASVVMGQAEPQDTPLKEYGELIVGRWIGEVMLVADWPGIGKKGEKVASHLTVRWIADKKGLEDESFGGQGTGKSIYFYDPTTKKIRNVGVDSGGTSGETEIWKEGDKWVFKTSGALADGTKAEGTGVLTVKDGGNTLIFDGEWKLGGTNTLPQHDVFRRASK
ncbi:MAG: hypothetical protein ACYC0X_27345 [Pirellulaceae bacterium]